MKIDRLFAITNILTEKGTVTAEYLAKYFGVSVRTIYRDIDILSSGGVPVYMSKGRNGGISVMEGYTIDKAMLSDKEQKQIISALQGINATGADDVAEPLAKLKNVFKKNSDDWLDIDFSSWENTDEEKHIFSVLKDCILERKTVSFDYFGTDGRKTLRTAEPLKIIFKWHNWYLYAFCMKRQEPRYFKLTRMDNVCSGGERYMTERNYEVTSEHEYKKQKIEVTLKIYGKMMFRAYDEFKGAVAEKNDDFVIVNAQLPYKSDWIYSYLLGFGEYLEIISPPHLKEEMKRYIKKIYERYF